MKKKKKKKKVKVKGSVLNFFFFFFFKSKIFELYWTELGLGVKWIVFPRPIWYGPTRSIFYYCYKISKQKTKIYLLK